MPGTREGRLKQAANQVGISLEEYLTRISEGQKHCYKCRTWQPLDGFHIDRSRRDVHAACCIACKKAPPRPAPVWGSPAEYERHHYATDEAYRFRRKQHAHSRQRNVSPLPKEAADFLLDYFDNTCAYCGGPFQAWDHIIPVVKGGQTTPGNIVPSCTSCNSSKKDRDVLVWADEQGIMFSAKLFTLLQEGGISWEPTR